MPVADFATPERCCDLVLKGGLTSGVLYPPAICRIAERFHLVGIGGTSAGAIAACAAAAAEYRRRRGEVAGYEMLAALPAELTGPGRLEGLFRPDAATKKLHGFVMDALAVGDASWIRRKVFSARALWALLRRENRLRPLAENGFGVCSGMAVGNPPSGDEMLPLTAWLAGRIDAIAGKEGPVPLTFGDLRHAPVPKGMEGVFKGREGPSIDLRAVTTALSFGRPYELPFESRAFAFDPDEWRRLFPESVVAYLVAEGEKIESETRRRDGKLPLPSGDAMPVIVAARMSLSFPGLFSMIPLYAANFHEPDKPLWRVWFSDGGITSNLPIHRFDGLFPRWPTLGINLQYTGASGKASRRSMGKELVYLIRRRSDGALHLWNRFDDTGTAVGDVLGFGGAIFKSAQLWHDNAFLRLPSFRDRVAEIWLRPEEGGTNLAMPPEVIESLLARGDEAGRALCARFADAPDGDPLSWNGHRWVRLRSGLAGLAGYLHRFRENVNHPMPGDPTLAELLASPEAPPCNRFHEAEFDAARKTIEGLLAYLDEAAGLADGAPGRPFRDGPRPPAEVGTRAPI